MHAIEKDNNMEFGKQNLRKWMGELEKMWWQMESMKLDNI
jgi:hypothetical protein